MKTFFVFICFLSYGCIPQAYKTHAEEGRNPIANIKHLLCLPSECEFENLIKARQHSDCFECRKSLSWFILKESFNVELNSGSYKWAFSSRPTREGLVEILKSKGTLISENELVFSNVVASSDYIQGEMDIKTAYGLSFNGTFCVKLKGEHLTIAKLTVTSKECKEKDFLLYNDEQKN